MPTHKKYNIFLVLPSFRFKDFIIFLFNDILCILCTIFI